MAMGLEKYKYSLKTCLFIMLSGGTSHLITSSSSPESAMMELSLWGSLTRWLTSLTPTTGSKVWRTNVISLLYNQERATQIQQIQLGKVSYGLTQTLVKNKNGIQCDDTCAICGGAVWWGSELSIRTNLLQFESLQRNLKMNWLYKRYIWASMEPFYK